MKQLSMLALIAAIATPLSAHATLVPARSSMVDLGLFSAGTYLLTGSGTVDLGGNFIMNPDGTPVNLITNPSYQHFNPSGSYYEFANGTGFGTAGTNAKLGALIGTLSTTPTVNDWFLIGYSKQLTLSVAQHIYASVNETFRGNDSGAYNVTVQAYTPPVVTVPEPAGAALCLTGLALIGALTRRRNKAAK